MDAAQLELVRDRGGAVLRQLEVAGRPTGGVGEPEQQQLCARVVAQELDDAIEVAGGSNGNPMRQMTSQAGANGG